jgi:hypothetical protein
MGKWEGAGEWKNEVFYGVIFSLFGPLLTIPLRSVRPHATPSLTNPYSFEISVHVVAQGTNNSSLYPTYVLSFHLF